MDTGMVLLLSPVILTALFLFGKIIYFGKDWSIIHLIKRNKKFDKINLSMNSSYDILETLLAASDNYLKGNAYGVVQNMQVNLKIKGKDPERWRQEITGKSQFDLVLLMKHCLVALDAVDFKGTIKIEDDDDCNEILTGINNRGEHISLKDNVHAPFLYLSPLVDLIKAAHLETKYINEKKGLSYPVFHIIIVGRNAEIEDTTQNGSGLLKTIDFDHIYKNINRCCIVRSEEEAMYLVDHINAVFEEKGVVFNKNEIIRGINNLCYKTIIKKNSLLPSGN